MKHHNDNCIFDTEKINQRLSELTEKKYSEEDIRSCFEESRDLDFKFKMDNMSYLGKLNMKFKYLTFEDYINSLNK